MIFFILSFQIIHIIPFFHFSLFSIFFLVRWSGNLIGASQSHHYLTIFTLNGFIKIYDVARHEPKLLYQPKSCYDLFGNFGEVIMAKCNATASHVAVTIATEMLMPDGKLHIWNIERDSVCEYDFMNKNERNINENIKNNLIGAMPAFANVSR